MRKSMIQFKIITSLVSSHRFIFTLLIKNVDYLIQSISGRLNTVFSKCRNVFDFRSLVLMILKRTYLIKVLQNLARKIACDGRVVKMMRSNFFFFSFPSPMAFSSLLYYPVFLVLLVQRGSLKEIFTGLSQFGREICRRTAEKYQIVHPKHQCSLSLVKHYNKNGDHYYRQVKYLMGHILKQLTVNVFK